MLAGRCAYLGEHKVKSCCFFYSDCVLSLIPSGAFTTFIRAMSSLVTAARLDKLSESPWHHSTKISGELLCHFWGNRRRVQSSVKIRQ